jgi:hypothetical protein
MDKHIGHLTVLNHGNTQGYKCDKHAREHGWIALVERVLAYEVKENGHGDQELQIELEHAPLLRPVVVEEVVSILELENLLVLGGVNALPLEQMR